MCHAFPSPCDSRQFQILVGRGVHVILTWPREVGHQKDAKSYSLTFAGESSS